MPARRVVVVFPAERPPEELAPGELRFAAARGLDQAPAELGEVRIVRASLDARKRHMVWRLELAVWPAGEEAPPPPATTPEPIPPPPPAAPRAAVVGAG
ncbi:MAG: hypothetical protein D6702_00320, partial [Planctomycetota bacterium]